MKRLGSYFLALLCCVQLSAGGIVPAGKAYMKQLQPRDSVLVADQIEYGFELDSVAVGTQLALEDYSELSNDTLTVVRNWQIDTLGRHKKEVKHVRLRGSVVLAPFEEGIYQLPPIAIQRTDGDEVDTLLFEGLELEVKTIPIDTAAFEIHDIKGQIRYPLTIGEVVPYVAAFWLLALAVAAIVCLTVMRRRIGEEQAKSADPAYIVALRRLEHFRSDKYWAPDKQKIMYSGITETLRTYIEDRFGINAEEMTTAEIFTALKGSQDITPELYDEIKELFETSDFVKFAKLTVTDEQNAKAIPAAVRFVTSTFQAEEEEEQDGEEAAKD